MNLQTNILATIISKLNKPISKSLVRFLKDIQHLIIIFL